MNRKLKVALAGNPNCGKTTLFNKLTKSRQKTGNYPGVTVDLSEGSCFFDDMEMRIIDLPGIYSLTSHSEEEVIARDYLINEKPDLVINVIDSSNLERGLFLTTQLMELQIPLVIVCNKIDLARAHDIEINFEKFSSFFEVNVIPTNATYSEGIAELLREISLVTKKKKEVLGIYLKFSNDLENCIFFVESMLKDVSRPRWRALKLIESDFEIRKKDFSKDFLTEVEKQIKVIKERYQSTPEEVIAIQRNQIISNFIKNISSPIYETEDTISDKIDRVILNKYLGVPIFFILIYFVFWFTFSASSYPSILLQKFFHNLSSIISNIWIKDSILKSLIVDGIIGGVGSVLSFVPNILFLFIAISFLEDSGYMARVAFVMDRIMHKIGLHGRSFLPMLLGFGCTVPAIMSARILENRRDRITTILVLPLIACSAKLAVFALLIPAFFSPSDSAKILFLLYLIGILIAISIITLLRKTLFRGKNIQFIMDMPPYQIPSMRNILLSTWEKAGLYLKRAGTSILALSILIWFLSIFPINKISVESYLNSFSSKQQQMEEKISRVSSDENLIDLLKDEFILQSNNQKFIRNFNIDLLNNDKISKYIDRRTDLKKSIDDLQTKFNEEIIILKRKKNEEQLYSSFMGRVGRALEIVFSPLGFDWRINTALIAALSAKEIFITQLGIDFTLSEGDKDISILRQQLKHAYTSLQGFSILLFLLISAPCIATVAMTKKETGSFKWAFIQLSGLTSLAYLLTLITYKVIGFF